MTPDYVAGVWVGFDRPRAILPNGSATGGRVAAPIWAEVMKRAPSERGVWAVPTDTGVVRFDASGTLPVVPALSAADPAPRDPVSSSSPAADPSRTP